MPKKVQVIRRPKRVAKSPKKVAPKPQVWIEVGPRGVSRWELTIARMPVALGFTKQRLVDLGRGIKASIVASGGRAELVEKGRDGRIQERDSGGYDPTDSEG